MANKFVSFLEAVGRDFKKGLDFILPFAEKGGAAAVGILAPEFMPLYNATVSAVVLAEQNAAAIGKQTGTGVQKSAAVVQLIGGLISTTLTDLGKPADDTAVQNWINTIVEILNAQSAPAPATTA